MIPDSIYPKHCSVIVMDIKPNQFNGAKMFPPIIFFIRAAAYYIQLLSIFLSVDENMSFTQEYLGLTL